MRSFDYQPGTRVVFGAGSFERLGDIAQSLGGRRVLVVSDPGIVAAGYAGRAMKILEAAGLNTWLFDGVGENPTTRHVVEGLRFAAPNNVDLIVGLGGGSSMDCAKGVNFLLTNGGKIADYWGAGKASKPLLPMIAVPTTAGTGSEAQSFALIADEHTHQKMACGDHKAMAAVAILDAELTLTQPARVTADTGIDAISHALETWVTKRRNPLSMLFSQESWRLLSAHFDRVLDNPSDVEARAAMQLGAFYAGTAIENSMLGAAHSCANPLTAHFDVVHGAAVGIMLPAVIRFNGSSVGALYGELAGSRDGAETLASRVESLLQRAALPRRLSEYKIPEDALPDLAREASSQWTAQFNPRPVTEHDLLEIYRCVY
jgi:alcohol dehydrogenase class IV